MKRWFNELVSYVRKNKKDIIARAIKTFVQACGAYLAANIAILHDETATLAAAAKSLLIGALAAGISAVWNAFLPSIKEWFEKLCSEEGEEDNGNDSKAG